MECCSLLAPSNKMTVEALFDLTNIVETATDKTVRSQGGRPSVTLGSTAMAQNVKLVLTGGRDHEYESADLTIENGGVLKVVEPNGYTTYYAAGEWRVVGHTSLT